MQIVKGNAVANATLIPSGRNPKLDMQTDVPVHIALSNGDLILPLMAQLGARVAEIFGLSMSDTREWCPWLRWTRTESLYNWTRWPRSR